MDKLRYAYGYVRVSTHDQEEISPDSQERLLRDYASKNNIVILKFFYELGVSGRKAEKRPEFQEMIASAKSKEHPVDAILVWKFSRFARNQEESIVYKSLLKKQNNVDVISISEPLIDGPFGSLIERIIEWMDEYYSIRLSGEVFRGMKENAMRGTFQARPPLGYRIAQPGNPPVIVPEEAEIIRTIFTKYVNEHLSVFDIARYLNSLGLKTSHKKPFERRSIQYILQNPIYCGDLRWNRTKNDTNEIKDQSEWIIVPSNHEPIISKELFEAAQERFAHTYHPTGARPASTYRHWLTGILKCPHCGRTMTACVRTKASGEKYCSFQCYGYSKGKCAKSAYVTSLVLEKEILSSLKEVLDTGNIDYELRKVSSNNIVDERSLLQDRLDSLSGKEDRIKASYMDGIDTLEEYKENKRMIQKEREEIERQLSEIVLEEPELSPEAALKRLNSAYSILISDQFTDAQKNAALRHIVDRITYNRAVDELKIYYVLYQ